MDQRLCILQMDSPDTFSASFPCSPGSISTFFWGSGSELLLAEVRSEAGEGGITPFVSSVVWSAPSASHKSLAHIIMPHQKKVMIDEGRTSLQEFSSKVREALDRERRSPDADGGTSSIIALEHSLWHLLEIFFIDASQSEGYVAEDLAAWLRGSGAVIDELNGLPSLDARLEAVLSGQTLEESTSMSTDASRRRPPDSIEDYWPLLTHLVAVGRVHDALTLLLAHSSMSSHSLHSHGSQHELVDALYVLLRQMPKFKLSGSSSSSGGNNSQGGTGREFDNIGEFIQYRSQWQDQCRRLPEQCPDLFASCQTSSPATFDGFATLLQVLGSSEEVALMAICSNWVELLVSHLIHLRPNAQARHHLKSLLSRCRQVKPAASTVQGGDDAASAVLPMLGDLLEALVDLEVQRVVEVLSSSGAVSPWFMAHAYELMRGVPRAKEAIERPLELFGGDQVEYWRLMVAEMMASQPSTSWLAVDYLALCPTYGAEAAEVVLRTLPLQSRGGGLEGREVGVSSRRVNKILHYCQVHGLGSVAASVCLTVGARVWYSGLSEEVGGRLGEAAVWMTRAGSGWGLAAVLRPAVLDALLASVSLGKGGSESRVDLEACARSLEDLEGLVVSLTPPPSPHPPLPSASGPEPVRACHTVTRFLRGFLRLRRSVEALASLYSSSTLVQGGDQGGIMLQVEEAALDSAREARQALMEDLLGVSDGLGCVVPHDLAMQILSWLVVPLLELLAKISSGVSGRTRTALSSLFSTQDVQALIRWTIEVDLASKTSKGGLIPAVTVREKEIERISPQGVKEVKRCLARALTGLWL